MVRPSPSNGNGQPDAALGWPRNFLNNRFVYLVLSQRARGLSVGINLNPDKRCNYQCVYCEVNRAEPARDSAVDIRVMIEELDATLKLVRAGRLREIPAFSHWPAELLELKEVALSGDGEPTLSPQFRQIVGAVAGLRSSGLVPFFKIVLITNTTGLHLPEMREGWRLLGGQDEIWVKFEAGTQAYMDRINVPDHRLRDVMANILTVALEPAGSDSKLFPIVSGRGALGRRDTGVCESSPGAQGRRGENRARADLFGPSPGAFGGVRPLAAGAALLYRPAGSGDDGTKGGSLLRGEGLSGLKVGRRCALRYLGFDRTNL